MKRWLAIFIIIFSISGGVVVLDSCKKPDIPFRPSTTSFQTPGGFPQPVYNFSAHPQTDDGFKLGRRLFYDGNLSKDGVHSCASCHQPVAAFTTFEHDRSHGYNHSHTLRNAPGLFNLAWYPYFNQDGGETDLTVLFEKHITSPTEMAENMISIVQKLKADPLYPGMFRSAFGSEEINSARVLDALSQFVVNLVSSNSRYDRMKRGEISFTAQEQNGYTLFQAKCVTCHTEPLFTDFSFRNVGIEVDMGLNDYGRKRITGLPEDSLKFRVPSLRNLEFTSYYMHDGRISLPRHMIQHYRFGVQQGPTLDPLLVNGIQMTNTEETDLVAFLRTLSDSSFLNNPRNRQ